MKAGYTYCRSAIVVVIIIIITDYNYKEKQSKGKGSDPYSNRQEKIAETNHTISTTASTHSVGSESYRREG